jgi:hypothetical protein
MQKKLEADLMSLAHSVLQMKNKEDVVALKEKARDIFEKLTMLAFVETYVNTTPTLKETKEELVTKVEKAFENKAISIHDNHDKIIIEPVNNNLIDEEVQATVPEIIEQPFDALEEILTSKPLVKEEVKKDIEEIKKEIKQEEIEEVEKISLEELKEITTNNAAVTNFKNDAKDVGERKTLEEELQDTIPVDIMANLFEPAKSKSLNDQLQTNIQIDLNDRIAFVKNLFDGSQEDFNRVVSQLNTFKTEKEAKKFVTKMVKPDYNWSQQEALEIRFIEIIERRFA